MSLRLKLQLILRLECSPHVRENPLRRRKSESQQLLYSPYSQRRILIRELISVKKQWCEGPALSAQDTHWGFTEFRYNNILLDPFCLLISIHIQYILCWLYPVCCLVSLKSALVTGRFLRLQKMCLISQIIPTFRQNKI